MWLVTATNIELGETDLTNGEQSPSGNLGPV